jgi:ABC-2 type transport system permease protein
MNKFFALLKKEVAEFLNLQQMLPLFIMAIAFVFIGKVVGGEAAREKNESKAKPGEKVSILSPQVVALDEDRTPASEELLNDAVGDSKRIYESGSVDSVLKDAAKNGRKALIIVPKGYSEKLKENQPQDFPYYILLSGLSIATAKEGYIGGASIGQINSLLSDQLIRQQMSSNDPGFLKAPVRGKENVYIDGRHTEASLGQLMGALAPQMFIIPILLYMVIVFATQIVAVAMASEQENKTLETLLSAPVNRNVIVLAKLLGAGVVALIFMGVYMVGFRYYLSGFSDAAAPAGSTSAALQALGLTYQPMGYALLGGSLFCGILCALAIAMIIGSFAEDVKGVQPLIMPLIMLTMVPYLFVLVLDFYKLSLPMRIAIYAIPFTHPFLASQNLLMHHYMPVIYGIGYELAVFAVCVFIASRLFASDKILTLKTSLRLRREAKKKSSIGILSGRD